MMGLIDQGDQRELLLGDNRMRSMESVIYNNHANFTFHKNQYKGSALARPSMGFP